MHTKFMGLVLLAGLMSLSATAQTNEKSEKKETIIIKKNSDKPGKMTIVVDGDKVTVNGKPIEELKDEDIEVLRNGEGRIEIPGIRGRLTPRGGMKMFRDGIANAGNRAFLGVSSEKSEKGAKISSVEKQSAADKIGLQKDDIISKVNDVAIGNPDDLYEVIGKYKPEEKVTITYLRDGKEKTASATLGKTKGASSFTFNGEDFNFDLPRMQDFNFNFSQKPRLGIEIQDLPEGKGVKILEVDKDSPAAKNGLQKDDIITEINGEIINSVDGMRSKLKDSKEGDTLKLNLLRNGKSQMAEIHFPKKLKTAEL